MILKVEHSGEADVVDFCKWLLPYIKSYAVSPTNHDKKLADKWNSYLESVLNKNGKIIVPTFNEIVYNYFDNLIVIEEESSCIITNDYNVKSSIGYTWDYLARLVSFGTLDMKGYPYFEEVFEHFVEVLQLYYNGWRRRS